MFCGPRYFARASFAFPFVSQICDTVSKRSCFRLLLCYSRNPNPQANAGKTQKKKKLRSSRKIRKAPSSFSRPLSLSLLVRFGVSSCQWCFSSHCFFLLLDDFV